MAVEGILLTLEFVPHECKTQEIYQGAIERNPRTLPFVPDQYKTHQKK